MATEHKFRLNDMVRTTSSKPGIPVGTVGIISVRDICSDYGLRHEDGSQSAWFHDNQLELIAHDQWELLDKWEDLDESFVDDEEGEDEEDE
ncbi:hypothetical protein fHeYen902_174 [Yersinia phage fHe-Yen9-02]|nr:hypothetical protein fHeYen902_174 [Yersinia phage fHe-Yen9-02]